MKMFRHSEQLHVVCLCAAWCHVCRDYGAVFASAFGPEVTTHWIDIEEQTELMGEYEVEQFPTVLVFDVERTYFAGPVRADALTLGRLLENCERLAAEQASSRHVPTDVHALVQRILQRELQGSMPGSLTEPPAAGEPEET